MTDTRPIRSMTLSSGDQSVTLTARTDVKVPDGVSTVTTSNPLDTVFVPTEAMFGDGDFYENRAAAKVADILISRKREFRHIPEHNGRIIYLWKAKGGKSGGRNTLGKCIKLSGLAKYLSQTDDYHDDNGNRVPYDFVIWTAADHCRDGFISNYQFEALIYHELTHIDIEEKEDKEGNPTGEMQWTVRGHDVEVFHNEIAEYGDWKLDLRQNRQAWEQLALKAGG